MTVEATVCHIIDGDRILLQKKSKGLFGEGKWNGVGGKLRVGESPVEGAAREAHEEAGIRVHDLRHHGVLRFYFGRSGEPDWAVHVFSTSRFEGVPRPSSEGDLRWFRVDEIPYESMWQDDEHWFPLMLAGKNFSGSFYFSEDGKTLIDFDLSLEALKREKLTAETKTVKGMGRLKASKP